jgi:hypothetical protein
MTPCGTKSAYIPSELTVTLDLANTATPECTEPHPPGSVATNWEMLVATRSDGDIKNES